jgi:hypothetical protein
MALFYHTRELKQRLEKTGVSIEVKIMGEMMVGKTPLSFCVMLPETIIASVKSRRQSCLFAGKFNLMKIGHLFHPRACGPVQLICIGVPDKQGYGILPRPEHRHLRIAIQVH